MTRICVTADFHGRTPPVIPECDLLLIAGDIVPGEYGYLTYGGLQRWVNSLDCKVVAVAGNHDFHPKILRKRFSWTYLEEEVAEVCGLKIWGSPWSPTFGNWAFMRDDSGLAEVWEKIPTDVDVIVNHGPIYGYGDLVQNSYSPNNDQHVGSITLRNRLEHVEFPNLKLIACGHIHEGYGIYTTDKNVTVINGAWVDADYKPGQAPLVIDI